MPTLRVSLFGRLRVEWDGILVDSLAAVKSQELFCYLLVNRKQPQSREALAEILWTDQPPGKSRKYLRQALWRLHSAFSDTGRSSPVKANARWAQFTSGIEFWVDAEEFEHAYNRSKTIQAKEFSVREIDLLRNAAALYVGNFLEGWYQDWCIIERERFQRIYLMMLARLVQVCESNGDYETGLAYGAEILRYDRAYERAHRQMMRLYLLADDRSQALRQYEHCVAALSAELGVAPSKLTVDLYEKIRSDSYTPDSRFAPAERDGAALVDLLTHLEIYAGILNDMQLEVHKEILEMENLLTGRH